MKIKNRRTGPCKVCGKEIEIRKGLKWDVCPDCAKKVNDELERMVEGKGKPEPRWIRELRERGNDN